MSDNRDDLKINGYEEPEEVRGYNTGYSPYMIDTEESHVQDTTAVYGTVDYDTLSVRTEEQHHLGVGEDGGADPVFFNLPDNCPICKLAYVGLCKCGKCYICSGRHRWYKRAGKLRANTVNFEHNLYAE